MRTSLLENCNEAQTDLNKGNTRTAINSVKAQSGKHITKAAANLLIPTQIM